MQRRLVDRHLILRDSILRDSDLSGNEARTASALPQVRGWCMRVRPCRAVGVRCASARLAPALVALAPLAAASLACADHAHAGDAALGAFLLEPESPLPPLALDVAIDGADDDAMPAPAQAHPTRAADACDVEPYGLVASDFNGVTITAAGVGLNWFVAERLSVGIFGEAMYVNQADENAVGGGGGVLFRWHFAQYEAVTLFGEVGVGFSFFDERVPADGTSVDFTPRAAVGAHLALDATTAVSARVGWLHLSNAQTGENNPGIDTLAVSLGLHIAY
jgi:hypothetical protein